MNETKVVAPSCVVSSRSADFPFCFPLKGRRTPQRTFSRFPTIPIKPDASSVEVAQARVLANVKLLAVTARALARANAKYRVETALPLVPAGARLPVVIVPAVVVGSVNIPVETVPGRARVDAK